MQQCEHGTKGCTRRGDKHTCDVARQTCNKGVIGCAGRDAHDCSVPNAQLLAGRAFQEQVNHPAHYGGKDNPYEAIKVIEAWGLSFNLGNCVKYVARAGRKEPGKYVEDLEKAQWYLARAIANIRAGKAG